MKKWLTILIFFIVLSCSKPELIPVSFYYWRTSFQLTDLEKEYINELKVNKLYIRYFDVALNNSEPVPVTSIVFNEKIQKIEIVPVIYIKNEVFLQNTDTKDLAQKIYNYIAQINNKNGFRTNEIQFDCDWSLKSKQNYFQFLADFKKLHPELSATIRLHQIKYPEKAGIPDVDKGVLMYYNMGVISSGDNNSIYDRSVAQRYIKSLQNYSLPLNIALPVFSWGVHIRDNKVVNLIGGLSNNDLQKHPFEKVSENRYRVIEDFIYQGRYLAKNDVVKIEEPSAEQLKEMMKDLKNHLKKKPNEIIFYDLNEKNVTKYEKETFKTVSRW